MCVADKKSKSKKKIASGTSTVAIDNKIEQAMDLVKSHLMFAVREEVEVLKEKIAELMDRINQLEMENSILKASAPMEILQQLPSPGSTTVLTGNGAVPPAAAAAAPGSAAAATTPAVASGTTVVPSMPLSAKSSSASNVTTTNSSTST